MNLRGAKPVVDYYFKHYISNLDCSSELYNDSLPQEFTENFYNWINSSTLNNLQGLDLFPSKRLVCGTAQAFDHFYLKHKARRFRFYKGEFMYHSACLKHGFDWAGDDAQGRLSASHHRHGDGNKQSIFSELRQSLSRHSRHYL